MAEEPRAPRPPLTPSTVLTGLVLPGVAGGSLATGLIQLFGGQTRSGPIFLAVGILGLVALIWLRRNSPGRSLTRKEILGRVAIGVLALALGALGIWLLTSD